MRRLHLSSQHYAVGVAVYATPIRARTWDCSYRSFVSLGAVADLGLVEARLGDATSDFGGFGPLLSASAIICAQFWSFARPGSTKAMIAATGVTSVPNAAATAPCFAVFPTSTPTEGFIRCPFTSIGVR